MKTETKRDLRGIAIRFGIVFLIVVTVLTFFSKTIENFLLPEVSVMGMNAGNIVREERIQTFPSYSESEVVYSPGTLPIERVEAEYGAHVEPESVIATVNLDKLKQIKDSLQLALLQAEVSVAQLEETLDEFDGTKAEREILKKQLAQAEIRLGTAETAVARLDAGVDENGNILAGVHGVVTEIALTDGMTIADGAELFRYADSSGSFVMSWEVSSARAAYFAVGNSADLYIEVIDAESAAKKTKSYKSELTGKRYNVGRDTYTFTVPIPEEAQGDITLQSKVDVIVSTTAVRYNCKVPKSAVYSDLEGEYLFMVTGEAGNWRAYKRYVDVLDEDSFYYALDLNVQNSIIVSSSKPIQDGSRIKLR